MFDKIIGRQFRIDLFEKDKNPRITFTKFKYSYNFFLACIIIDDFPPNNSFDKWIYGESLPSDITAIGETNIIVSNNKLEEEINWILISVRKYKNEINKFLVYKKQFETELIIGNYEKAEEILDLIDTQISLSLWSIENRFLLIELRKGLKENTGFLNDINTQNKKPFIRYLAHFYSTKAEKELSVNRYEVNLVKFLLPLIDKGFNADLDYYFFKLNPFVKNRYEHLSEILAFENYNSIIDKYTSLIKIFQLIITSLSDTDKELRSFIGNRLFYLDKKVKDNNIKILRTLVTDKFEDIIFDPNDKYYIKILDSYTSGEYEKCQKMIEVALDLDPLIFELYPIYIKSLIQQRKVLNYGKKDSFQSQILSALFDLLKKEKNPVDSGIVLKKIAYNLSNISNISYSLIDIIKTEIENDNSFNKLSIINASFLNPQLSKIHSNPIKFLDFISKKIKESSTVNLFSLFAKENITLNVKSDIDPNRFNCYQASNYQIHENFFEASQIWENLLENETLNFKVEKALINLFFCKAKLGEFDSCINLFVKYYFKNKYLIQRLGVNLVKDEIKKAKYKNIIHSVELPIFFFLTNSEGYDIHTAYECFLLNNDCEKASELIDKIDLCDNYLIFFLKNICNLEVFKHSPFITNTKNKFNERIKICQYLAKIDPQNKDEYKEEETLLSNRLIIQKGLQEIDESKIYVNQDSIILNELKDLKSIFNRYVSIAQLSTEKGITFINLGSERMYNVSLQEEKTMDIEFSKDPQYDIFKEMFYEIRDKFLYSKYGLKLNLSTRIRHGVLEGEIRSEFVLLNLITEKENASNVYKQNKYWRAALKAYNNEDDCIIFDKLISDFSHQIDSLIYDEILAKYLLIRTEKENPNGWLDYKYEEVELQVLYSLIYKKITSYNEFIDSIFKDLWIKTDKNLIEIQIKIKNEFRDKFFDTIFKFENMLQKSNIILPDELLTNLTVVKTKVENKLSKIASWFTITDSQISDFDLNKIVEVCCESLHNHYTSKKIVLDKNIRYNELFKGMYFTHLVYLLRIFFQNILDYSSDDTVNIYLNVTKIKNMLQIEIENKLNEDEDIQELKEKIKIEDDIKKSQLDKRSGLYKALNIVKTSFEDEENELNLDVIDNKFCVTVKLNLNKILA